MANVGMQLLSRVIRTGELNRIIEWGITLEDMSTNEEKAMFNSIMGYYQDANTRGSVIGPHLLEQRHPNFQLCDDEGVSLDALCFEARKKRLRHIAKEAAQALVEGADVDPLGALAAIHAQASQLMALGYNKNVDVDFSNAYGQILQEYQDVKAGKSTTRKMIWPWPPLEDATGGLQEDDYIVLYGRPKSMKSWVLSYLIAHCFLTKRRAVLYTKEMTTHNIFKRIAACIIGLPYDEFRRGRLQPDQEELLYYFEDTVKELESSNRLIALSAKDVAPGSDTVSWLQSKVEKYKPDVCFVDGLYLMSDPSSKKAQDWVRVTNISRAVRGMILETKTPVIATMQANRKAAGHSNAELDEIAYSDAISQDVTMAARVINEVQQPTIALVLGGSREFTLHGVRIHGVPATNFGFHSEMNEKDIHKVKQQDSKGMETDNPKNHSKMRSPSNTKGIDTQYIENEINKL